MQKPEATMTPRYFVYYLCNHTLITFDWNVHNQLCELRRIRSSMQARWWLGDSVLFNYNHWKRLEILELTLFAALNRRFVKMRILSQEINKHLNNNVRLRSLPVSLVKRKKRKNGKNWRGTKSLCWIVMQF